MTRASIAGLGIALAFAIAGCGPKRGPNGASAGDAILVVRSNVRDAQVYVDGRFIASLEALHGGLALEPGAHRLELRRDDYFSRYLEVSLARAEHKQVTLELSAILP